jgi:hypothetical protein
VSEDGATAKSALARPADPGTALRVYEEFLGHQAFVHRVDLAVLTKIAVDERAPARERRRAAEALGQLYLRAVEIVGQLARVKEEVVGPWGAAPERSRHGRSSRPRARGRRAAPSARPGDGG